MTAPTIYPTEAAWLAARPETCGASESGALVDGNEHEDPLIVYARKVEGYEPKQTRKMLAGRLLERGILNLWAADKDAELEPLPPFAVWRSPDAPLSCTPDALAKRHGELVVAEAKNVGRWAKGWNDGPPLYSVVQVQVQLGVLRANGVDVSKGFLVPFYGGDDTHEHEIDFDEELFILVRAKVKRFWEDHIIPKIPPQPGKYATAEDVRRVWRKSLEGKRVEVPRDLIARKLENREARKVHDDAGDMIDRDIMAVMGDAEIGTVDGVDVISWKAGTQQRKAQEAREVPVRPLRLLKAAEGVA